MSRQSTSAIGLRQVLPVQTNNTIRLESRCKVRSGTTPARSTSYRPFCTRTTDDGWPKRHGPSSTTRLDLVAEGVDHFLGGDGLGHSRAVGAGQASAARPASAARRGSPDGPARAGRSPAAGETACCTFGGSCRTRLSGCESSTTSVTGPGQHRRASRWAKRTHVGGVVAGLVGALDGQRQRLGRRPVLATPAAGTRPSSSKALAASP